MYITNYAANTSPPRCFTPLIEVCSGDRALRIELDDCIKCGALPTHLELRRHGCPTPPRYVCVEEQVSCGCNTSITRTRKVEVPEPTLLVAASHRLGSELVFVFDENVLNLERGRYMARFHYADGSVGKNELEIDLVGVREPNVEWVTPLQALPAGGCDV